ncbi:hypothetical protein [Paracoccus beibuensis]|uniref:hypothetical protein n=1 Tax=Paracoccus beibuensis TaxID=547602 RepID=UPI002240CA41|nr:hypothetical protein [Paracoccus beibuensis]
MCGKPDIPEPQQMPAGKAPVFSTATETRSKTGRQGTLLTRPTAWQEYPPGGKKTLLGT